MPMGAAKVATPCTRLPKKMIVSSFPVLTKVLHRILPKRIKKSYGSMPTDRRTNDDAWLRQMGQQTRYILRLYRLRASRVEPWRQSQRDIGNDRSRKVEAVGRVLNEGLCWPI